MKTQVAVNEADKWGKLIAATWQRTAESIIETGRLLVESKAALEHGQWLGMVAKYLPFEARTAERLMEISRDQRLVNPSILPLLPGKWTELHKYTKMDVPTLHRCLKLGEEAVSGSRAMMGSRVEHKESLDFLPTPPWATRTLIETILPQIGIRYLDGAVWEPACGEGHMAEVLAEYGPVLATDIKDYGYSERKAFDFLIKDRAFPVQWIITNPPFADKAEQFTLKALSLAKLGVAMFVPLRWLETIGRYERLFCNQPPTLVSFFAERVNLCKGEWKPNGSTATAYIWLVWVKGKRPQPPFWIPPGQQERLTRPDDAERFTAHPVTKKNHQPAAELLESHAAAEPAPDVSPPASSANGAGSTLSDVA